MGICLSYLHMIKLCLPLMSTHMIKCTRLSPSTCGESLGTRVVLLPKVDSTGECWTSSKEAYTSETLARFHCMHINYFNPIVFSDYNPHTASLLTMYKKEWRRQISESHIQIYTQHSHRETYLQAQCSGVSPFLSVQDGLHERCSTRYCTCSSNPNL